MAVISTVDSSMPIARGAAIGEAKDCGLLFREHHLRAYHFTLQLTGNPEDAMDITQEAFLRVHRHWRRRDKSRPFLPWLYSIIRNLTVDLYRRRGTRKETDWDEAPPQESPHPGPGVLAERNELKERIWQAIRQLSPEQREVLVLRDMQGFAYKEIAAITGNPVTTVNSRLHDAREILRRKLGRYL